MADVKLVRDLIPDIAPGRWFRTAGRQEMWDHLVRKLAEESGEVAGAKTLSGRVEEMADVLEVVYAMTDLMGVPRDELERVRRAKLDQRGGFTRRLVMTDGADHEPCPRCKGSGIDPEDSHPAEGPSEYSMGEPPVLEPCRACQFPPETSPAGPHTADRYDEMNEDLAALRRGQTMLHRALKNGRTGGLRCPCPECRS